MSTTTTPDGHPYPNPDEPVANMDLSIKALAQAVDTKAIVVNRTAVQSIPNNVATAVTFTAEDSDVSNLYALGAGITIPVAGLWLLTGVGGVAGTTGVKFVQLLGPGAVEWAAVSHAAATGLNHRASVAAIVKAAAGDVFQLALLQSSGGAQNTFGTQRLAAVRLAPTA